MPKQAVAYVCRECGEDYHQWQGQCRACRAWNSLDKVNLKNATNSRANVTATGANAPQRLNAIDLTEAERIKTFAEECNRVLGGGLVPGSAVLLGGAPGAGKSTLLLQILCDLAKRMPVLYVSGEESAQQLALRAERLGFGASDLPILIETRVNEIIAAAEVMLPRVMVVDSIQMLFHEGVTGSPGGVSQVRECAMQLVAYARAGGCVLLLIGHVTKEGALAGPRVLEHGVDCSITMETSSDQRLRTLRAQKNRFGAINEIGLFAMLDKGLREVKNPSSIFLSGSELKHPGTLVTVLWEGTRPILIEIQTLVDRNQSGSTPRRVVLGMDYNRLLLLLAVMHKHARINCFDQDVFASLVGGMRVSETSVDLALMLAIASSLKGKVTDRKLVAFAEVGLTGELRPVSYGQERLHEAAKHGFSRALVAKGNMPKKPIAGIEARGVTTVAEALAEAELLI